MNTCVCCGKPIPEGSQVCWECLHYPYDVILRKNSAGNDCSNHPHISSVFRDEEKKND